MSAAHSIPGEDHWKHALRPTLRGRKLSAPLPNVLSNYPSRGILTPFEATYKRFAESRLGRFPVDKHLSGALVKGLVMAV